MSSFQLVGSGRLVDSKVQNIAEQTNC